MSHLPRNITHRDVEHAHVQHINVACGLPSCECGKGHGVLEALGALTDYIHRLEHNRRLLVAYARRNTHRPLHTLKELADATDMSISGVRSACNDNDVIELMDILYPPSNSPLASSEISEEEVPR
jgi:hypothetical protein